MTASSIAGSLYQVITIQDNSSTVKLFLKKTFLVYSFIVIY